MKTYLITFPLQTGKKKRLITTYRANQDGEFMRHKHEQDLTILEQNYQIDTNYCFAYIKEQSIKNLVKKHIDNQYFYQFDISNFFNSINHKLLLTKLNSTPNDFNQQLIAECSNQKSNGLALGLVPSPYLSNIYLADFDQLIVSRLKAIDQSVIYTRYSDDLTISSKNNLQVSDLIEVMSTLLADFNLSLNSAKTKSHVLNKKGDHIKILGLNLVRGLNSNYITVGRKFKTNTDFEKNPQRKQAMASYIEYNEK